MDSVPCIPMNQDTHEMSYESNTWTSQYMTADRRRQQNRLNQRAWRQRKKLRQQQEALTSSRQGPGVLIFSVDREPEKQLQNERRLSVQSDAQPIPELCSLYVEPAKSTRALTLYRNAYQEYSLKAPRPANLSALIRLNLLHAVTRNSYYIGILPGRLCRDEFISPFNIAGPCRVDNPCLPACPMSLQPTMTQRRIVHHPWIDLIPFSRVRDNILLGMEEGTIDDDELLEDLMEFGSGDADLVNRPAMIVWGEASECSSWEVNTAFIKKWRRLLRGCPELIASTNTWRSKRGEIELHFDV